MHVDEKMLDEIWSTLRNKHVRSILKFIGDDGAYDYMAILNFTKSITSNKTSSGKSAYFIKKLLQSELIKLDIQSKKYILTRVGVLALTVVESFDTLCHKFDLSDTDDDGKVEFVIKDRDFKEKSRVKCMVCNVKTKTVRGMRVHHRKMHVVVL